MSSFCILSVIIEIYGYNFPAVQYFGRSLAKETNATPHRKNKIAFKNTIAKMPSKKVQPVPHWIIAKVVKKNEKSLVYGIIVKKSKVLKPKQLYFDFIT